MISIVITTYGGDHWPEIARQRAVPSAQRLEPSELIVHHSFAPTIGPARNEAASLATGEWLLFLDADDELSPDYLDQMTHAICSPQRPEPALLQPSVSYVRKGRPAAPILIRDRDLRKDNHLVIGTVLRRSLFHKVGGFNDYPHGFEDWSLWAKCWKAGAQVWPVKKAVYYAHINPQSAHRVLWRDKEQQAAMHMQIKAELFPD